MRLEKGRIRLYLADIRPLLEEKAQSCVYQRMDEERRQKADGCKPPGVRAASLGVGFLAQYALEKNGYEDCCVCYHAGGQPFVRKKSARNAAWESAESPVYISLSHSGDYAVCALAAIPVGVDIQKKEPIRAVMLRHFFCEAERLEFEKRHELPKSGLRNKEPVFLPDQAAEEFLRLWTAKESFMKLTGEGMAMGFANLSADLEEGLIREKSGLQRTGLIREYKAPEGYYLTACIRPDCDREI